MKKYCFIFLLMHMSCVASYAADYDEYNVKAAFVYHFCRFTEWPDHTWIPETPFHIAVIGNSAFADALQKSLQQKKAHNLSIVVSRIERISDFRFAHVLVMPDNIPETYSQWLEQHQGLAILTISDDPQAISKGVMVQLLLHDNQVRFRINTARSQQNGLHISPRLLKLADQVIGKNKP